MFEQKLNEYIEYFNTELNKTFAGLDEKVPEVLRSAMKYAVNGTGKRVRPVLTLATAEMFGIDKKEVVDFAVAIECIHSYSLVHDDLPAMDNDDYRRGKLSTHKKYGEAFGILCGDALLNFAFEILLNGNLTSERADAIKIVAEYAGYKGMIAGQVTDILCEKSADVNENLLYDIYINKTCKLLMAPLLVVSCLNDKKFFNELKEFGYNLGIMFQITDDILDVTGNKEKMGKTPHKDENKDKLTAVKVFGLKGAEIKAEFYFNNCLKILRNIPNSNFLIEFTEKIFTRKG